MEQPNRYMTIRQAAVARPAFTQSALRDMKLRAFDRTNSRGDLVKGNGTGAAGVWIQVGRKVLVDIDRLDAWIESHRIGDQ
jgi:hypothetical protein